jgi:hypothetical protein
MYWTHFGAAKNRELVEAAGFTIELDEIETEASERHQVILAKRAPRGGETCRKSEPRSEVSKWPDERSRPSQLVLIDYQLLSDRPLSQSECERGWIRGTGAVVAGSSFRKGAFSSLNAVRVAPMPDIVPNSTSELLRHRFPCGKSIDLLVMSRRENAGHSA